MRLVRQILVQSDAKYFKSVDEANREAILTSLSANLTLLSVHLTLLLEIMHCARNLVQISE